MHAALSINERYTYVLFSVHRIARAAGNLNFLCFLTQCKEGAAQMAYEITATVSADSLLFPDLASNECSCNDVDGIKELGQAAQAAAVSHDLGVLPERVTGTEVSDDAQSTVIKAATYPVTPLARHDQSKYVLLSVLKMRQFKGLNALYMQSCTGYIISLYSGAYTFGPIVSQFYIIIIK